MYMTQLFPDIRHMACQLDGTAPWYSILGDWRGVTMHIIALNAIFLYTKLF